jgi:branched-chain amino acid aminotransferase
MSSTRSPASSPASSWSSAASGLDVDRRIWIDGRLVPWRDATVHVLSHSLARGSLVFDYLSVHETPRGPAIFRLPEHLRRFERSVSIVGLPMRQSYEELFAGAVEAVAANPGATALKVFAYLPSIEVDVVPMDERVAVAMAAYDPLRDVILKKSSPRKLVPTLRLKIERTRRRIESHLPTHAKAAANYLGPMMAKWAARKEGYDEVVMLDEHGHLAEAPTSNVFVLDAGGTLRTPALDAVLPGVTRMSVVEIAKHEGVAVEEGTVEPEALLGAREAFLASTTVGVWPVDSVDGRALPTPVPGQVTAAIKERFDRVTAGLEPDFAHWLTPVVLSPANRAR